MIFPGHKEIDHFPGHIQDKIKFSDISRFPGRIATLFLPNYLIIVVADN